ncbi:MAG: hypothetical protein NWQ25_07200, partial [Prochlorococcaceae cyanobacterium MAG_34]|nr:hypothetical protein [Prochlorococcaceae cyanobacterium MAG_34]
MNTEQRRKGRTKAGGLPPAVAQLAAAHWLGPGEHPMLTLHQHPFELLEQQLRAAERPAAERVPAAEV